LLQPNTFIIGYSKSIKALVEKCIITYLRSNTLLCNTNYVIIMYETNRNLKHFFQSFSGHPSADVITALVSD